MTVHYSVAVRDAKLDVVETVIGTAPILRVYSGGVPVSCIASPGTVIAEGVLPSDWLAPASGGTKVKAGTWTITGVAAAGGGTDGTYYRIYDAGDTTCHEQGSFGDGGTEDMVADNANIANLQVITVNTFVKTAGNA